MKYLPIVLLLSGCASLLPGSVQEKISSGVLKYCGTMTKQERAIIRADVNSVIAPNSIQVTCAGDLTMMN